MTTTITDRLARLREELEDVKSGRYEHACGLDVHDPEAVCLQLCGLSLMDRLEDEIARLAGLERTARLEARS